MTKRIAVCGCGSIGRRHLQNLRTGGWTDIAVFDPASQLAHDAAARWGVSAALDLDALWRTRPDVVFVTAPPDQHVPIALAAAERGCDLFIEKPLSHSLDGIDRLKTLVHDRELIAMVGCNMRFHPGVSRLHDLLRKGAIGRVLAARLHVGSDLPAWRPGTSYKDSYSADPHRGGAVLDCIHEIDLALWLLGPAALSAAVVRPADVIGLTVDGLAELLLEHESGAVSSVHLNFVQRDYHRAIEVIGEAGSLYWDFNRPQVELRDGSSTVQTWPLPDGWDVNQMYVDEIHAFMTAVANRSPVAGTIDEGEAALRIALTARQLAVPAR